jgi:hypothetical protein
MAHPFSISIYIYIYNYTAVVVVALHRQVSEIGDPPMSLRGKHAPLKN